MPARATFSGCLGHRIYATCRSCPGGEIDPVGLVRGRPPGRLRLQSGVWQMELCWAISQLPRCAGLHVLLLVSLGETVSLRDKIRQRLGRVGTSPKPKRNR